VFGGGLGLPLEDVACGCEVAVGDLAHEVGLGSREVGDPVDAGGLGGLGLELKEDPQRLLIVIEEAEAELAALGEQLLVELADLRDDAFDLVRRLLRRRRSWLGRWLLACGGHRTTPCCRIGLHGVQTGAWMLAHLQLLRKRESC
jgi:hypothetical protein